MDSITMEELSLQLPESDQPHYDGPTIRRLIALAEDWCTKFTPHINDRLDGLPGTYIWLDSNGVPKVTGSEIVGQVSWMEDFTLFAIHPERDWDVDMPKIIQATEYELNVNCALGYKGDNGLADVALVYDPRKPLPGKQRQDIARALKSVGEVVITVEHPTPESLLVGARRWNRHAMSGDYFVWQWLWATAAGTTVRMTGDGFSAWLNFVTYVIDGVPTNVFTAYHAEGNCNGIGVAGLHYALAQLGDKRCILTSPLPPKEAARYKVSTYETYKRRFANDSIPVHFLAGKWGFANKPHPPYYDALAQEMVLA